MVKTEVSLLEVQRKGLCWDAFQLGQAQFGVGPEGLDSVIMAVSSSELVFSVMDPEVLGVADIDQALIASPAITMNDTFDRDMVADNLLQRGFSRIWDDFCVEPAIAFEDTEDTSYAPF
jgi:hypothetical protein